MLFFSRGRKISNVGNNCGKQGKRVSQCLFKIWNRVVFYRRQHNDGVAEQAVVGLLPSIGGSKEIMPPPVTVFAQKQHRVDVQGGCGYPVHLQAEPRCREGHDDPVHAALGQPLFERVRPYIVERVKIKQGGHLVKKQKSNLENDGDGGHAVYWFKTSNGFPASTGPLVCTAPFSARKATETTVNANRKMTRKRNLYIAAGLDTKGPLPGCPVEKRCDE